MTNLELSFLRYCYTPLKVFRGISWSLCPFVRPSPSLIRYSSKTAEQNFMTLSGIVHYMMPYCTSYLEVLYAWCWGFPEQNKDFAITTYGGDPSLIRCSSKTAEQNFMELSGLFTTWCHTAPSILNFYSNDFGFPQSKTRTLPYKTWGSGGYHFVSIAHSISSFDINLRQTILTIAEFYNMQGCVFIISRGILILINSVQPIRFDMNYYIWKYNIDYTMINYFIHHLVQ